MLFLSPLALFGLGAALVPPLLHLFQRRSPPAFEFPAVRYLAQTEREAERRLKLRNLLLMLLRVAAIVALVLAAARPVVPRAGVAAVHEPTAVAIVLDNSLSSGAVAGGRRVLDDLAQRARETLRAAQPGDALWVIGADQVARRGTRAELLDLVTRMPPAARRLDLVAAAGEAARLVEGSGYARGEVHLLTDLQRTALGDGSEDGRSGDRAAGSDTSLAGVTVLVYHPSGDPPPNRGVVAAAAVPPLWLAGTGTVAARIGGSGAARGAGGRVSVALQLGGRAGGRALADSGEVVLAAPALAAGWRTGEVTLEPDELLADDRRPVAVRVVAPAAVELSASADPGPFVRQAVAALVAGRQAVAGGGVLVGAPDGRRPAIVFPPADAAGLGALNRALAAAGTPWQFGERVEREDSLAAPTVPELRGARVRVRWRLVTPGGAADSGQVVARVAGSGEPWLVRAGAVVIVASRMVPEQTGLPLGGGFVPFVSALVNRVVRGEAGVLGAAPGASVAPPAGATALGLGADSARPLRAGAPFAAPEAPGVYPVLAGADTAAMLVVAPDPRESDLTRATPADLRAHLPRARVTVTDAPAAYAAARFRGAGRSELTGALLAAALLLLLAEAAVAAGRRTARAAA